MAKDKPEAEEPKAEKSKKPKAEKPKKPKVEKPKAEKPRTLADPDPKPEVATQREVEKVPLVVVEKPMRLPVKARVLGYYEGRRWKPGQEFFIAFPHEYSHVWMEALGWTPPAAKPKSRPDFLRPGPAQRAGLMARPPEKEPLNEPRAKGDTADPSATSAESTVGRGDPTPMSGRKVRRKATGDASPIG